VEEVALNAGKGTPGSGANEVTYELFAFKLALAFAGGWAVVAAVTAVADKFGTGRAGFIGGLPSTGPVSLLFIGLSQSQKDAVTAVSIFPLAFSISFAFLLFYSWHPSWTSGRRMAFALALWFVLSILVSLSRTSDFLIDAAVGIAFSCLVFVIHRRLRIQSVTPQPTKFSLVRTSLRGILGGLVVVGVVTLTSLVGPTVGGVFTAAPAIWSSSLLVTSRAQGVEFSRAITRSFIKTGILTAIPFGIAARFLFSAYGLWSGTFLSYIAILPLAFVAWRLTKGSRTG